MSSLKKKKKKGELDELRSWSLLSNKEKQNARELVKVWMQKNYTPSPTACLPRQLVYQHFKSFCKKNLNIKRDRATFGRLLAYAYPHVQFRRLGSRGESKYYYHGLDSLETNSYHQKIQGAKVESTKAISIPIEIEPTEDTGPAIHDCLGDCADCRLRWKTTDENYKTRHKDELMAWLEKNYEICPQVCLLRQTIFDHYRKYCQSQHQVPAPPAIFGRMLVQKFAQLTMRRLGPRGNSKYYYMGIDILEESSEWRTMCAGRIECPAGKPKFSRVFNGSPTTAKS